MGYRSEVTIAIKKEVYQKHSIAFKDALEFSDCITQTEKAIYFVWESAKWYSDYPEIAAVESVLSDLDDSDYGYVRVGEEMTDLETRGDFYEYGLDVSRAIVIDEVTEEVDKELFLSSNSVKFIIED